MNRIVRCLVTATASAALLTTVPAAAASAAPRSATTPAVSSAVHHLAAPACIGPNNPVWGDGVCPSH